MPWVYDPHSGGIKIPSKIYEKICEQVESFVRTRPWYPNIQLKARFKSQFCYIETIEEGDERHLPLCRLRHFDLNDWSFSLFTYSNNKYEPCNFRDGKQKGTIADALEICELFIV